MDVFFYLISSGDQKSGHVTQGFRGRQRGKTGGPLNSGRSRLRGQIDIYREALAALMNGVWHAPCKSAISATAADCAAAELARVIFTTIADEQTVWRTAKLAADSVDRFCEHGVSALALSAIETSRKLSDNGGVSAPRRHPPKNPNHNNSDAIYGVGDAEQKERNNGGRRRE
ncbi:unnamed protein product, partial [Iphiclides podalirius]